MLQTSLNFEVANDENSKQKSTIEDVIQFPKSIKFVQIKRISSIICYSIESSIS